MQTFLYVVHFTVCFILIGVVLLQRGKGQDLGASLGGGSANTLFGSRGAGNFLTRITTASAVVFMVTSLSLSYLGYQSSDVRLFDESEPFVPEGAAPRPAEESGLQEIPAAAGDAAPADSAAGLVEIPSDGAESAATPEAAPEPGSGSSPGSAAAPTAPPVESTPSAESAATPAADGGAASASEPAKQP